MTSFDTWFQCLRRKPGARLRLFAFTHAGSGAAVYRPWDDHLPRDVELWAVKLPGREARIREAPFDRMEPLIAALAPAIEPQLGAPYAVFGHSMGGLVAYELTRALAARGARLPERLFISARPAPLIPRTDPPAHTLPRDQLLARLVAYNAVPREVLAEKELIDLILPVFRADMSVLERHTFVPQAPLPVPLSVFGGVADAHVPREHLERWRELTAADFSLEMLPGDHFYLNDPRQRAALIASICRAL